METPRYGRNEEYGSENYRQRLAFFAKRRSEVDAQNAKPETLAVLDVNGFHIRGLNSSNIMNWLPRSSLLIGESPLWLCMLQEELLKTQVLGVGVSLLCVFHESRRYVANAP